MWGLNIDCGRIIKIRFFTKEGVRPFWDILLTCMHELAHGHPIVKGYGGRVGHGNIWKKLY